MKKWNFKVKSNIQEITKKLDATLGSSKGFVFNIENNTNDSATFKVRKRALYAFYLLFINKIIVNGSISKTNSENETHIEISFTQYFLWKLVILTHLLLGLGYLIAIITETINNLFMFVPAILLVVVGFVLLTIIQKKFKKDVQEYKTLISGILDV